MSKAGSVGVVVLTYRGREHLARCLPPPRGLAAAAPGPDRRLVLRATGRSRRRKLGAETLVIPQTEFNHGATRKLARTRVGTNVPVMVSQYALQGRAFTLITALVHR